jgi:hypothetical protein
MERRILQVVAALCFAAAALCPFAVVIGATVWMALLAMVGFATAGGILLRAAEGQ